MPKMLVLATKVATTKTLHQGHALYLRTLSCLQTLICFCSECTASGFGYVSGGMWAIRAIKQGVKTFRRKKPSSDVKYEERDT